MAVKTWKTVSSKLYTHSPYRRILDVVFELPDGRQETYALSQIGRVVTVLAFTEDNRVICARQFRPGPGVVLDDLPGGLVDEGEELEAACRRELREETGYEAGTLTPLGMMYVDGYSTVQRHAFLARGCRRVAEQKLDRNEFIEVVLKPVPEFLAQIRAGLSTNLEVAWAGLLEAGFLRADLAGSSAG